MVNTRESGYIALMAVLIVGAAATAIALVLLVSGSDAQRSALIEQQSKQARVLAIACGQEALQQIHDNLAFSGTATLTMGQGSCSYVVAVSAPTTRSIVATGTVGNVIRKLQAACTVNIANISLTSWQEISP